MSPAKPLRLGPVEAAMLLLLSVLWGGSFFFNAVAVAEIPVLTFIFFRVAIAAAALWVIVALRGAPVPWTGQAWRRFLVMGALNCVGPFSLIAWAQTAIPSGLAAILNATVPFWTVLIAHVLTVDEKASANKLGGVVLGAAGVAVIVGPAAFGAADYGLLPPLASLGATLLYAYTGVFARRFSGSDPVVTAAGQLTCASLVAAPLALALDRPWTIAMPSLGAVLSVLAVALLSTALAYILYFRIVRTAGATNVVLVTLLAPIPAVILGALVLGERLDPRAFLGMALVAVGIAVSDGRLLTWLRLRGRAAFGRT